MTQTNLNLTRWPAAGPHLVGREAELAQLDAAWQAPDCHLLCLTGEDGLGKTSLLDHWLRSRPWTDGRVYGWSFYSQGSAANQNVAADFFIDDALRCLGAEPDPARGLPWERGRRLARLLQQQPGLLLLDGLELLLVDGRLKDPALLALLHELSLNNSGLCLLAGRQPLTGLPPTPAVRTLALPPLTDAAAVTLLRAYDLNAGEAELRQAGRLCRGRPLALALLAGLVQDAWQGDPGRLAELPPAAGDEVQRLLLAWADWLGHSPEQDILRLVGLFLRPTDPAGIRVLRTPPAIEGLTGRLFSPATEKMLGLWPTQKPWPLPRAAWEAAIERLRRANLLLPAAPGAGADDVLDAHPLVRKFFARQLGDTAPRAWYAGHERLYRYYSRTATETDPGALPEMEPLYTALAHGCRANKAAVALEEVYLKHILRKDEQFSSRRLGAFGADLAGLANCFRQPGRRR
ncbi:MAG: ATP-binding protein [Chloroflexota bacterium]